MKIRTKLHLFVYLLLLTAISLIAIHILAAIKEKQAGARGDKATVIVKELNELEMITAAYLLHSEERYAADWRKKYQRIAELFDGLRDFSGAQLAMIRNMEDDRKAVGALFTTITGIRAYADNSTAGKFRDMMIGQLSIRLQRIISSAFALEHMTDQEMRRFQNLEIRLVTGLLILLASIIFALAYMTRRNIDMSLSRLEKGAEALSSGNLAYRIEIRGGDELSELGKSFNAMADNLCQSYGALQESAGALKKREEEAKKLAQERATIAEIGRIISSTLNINEVYERFAGEARKLIPFDRISVAIINSNESTYVNAYTSGVESLKHRVGSVNPLVGSTTDLMLKRRSGLLIQAETEKEVTDLYPAYSNMLQAEGIQSKLSVPLISEDRVIGALHFRSLKTNAFTEIELRLAETIADQIAGAVANAELFAERNRLEQERIDIEERLHRSEKMEALGTLAGGVAHDLNNVLGVTMAYAELLQEKVPEGSPLQTYAGNILSSSGKAAAIIQDLLTLARRGVSVSKVMDLNCIVTAVLHSPEFERLKDYHPSVIFKTEVDKNLLNIKGSLVHLEKTVFNLLANAVEAISGRGEVIIRTENRYLDKPVHGNEEVKEGDYAVLAISDTGEGIRTDDLSKIFEPFYTKKSMGRSGTGLGLSIVWGTVKDHSGYIDVQSVEGRGTTFTLYFPVTRERVAGDEERTPVEQYVGRGESVLVVDDVPEQRQMANVMLTRLGYQVNAVSSGEEAVEHLKNNKADILVLDMIMTPGIDGLETYRRILEISPKQKAVIVSGFSETDRVMEAQTLGAGAYVKKPYIMENIGMAVRLELDRK